MFPVSDWASDALISLPLHPQLDEADLACVVATLAEGVAATRMR